MKRGRGGFSVVKLLVAAATVVVIATVVVGSGAIRGDGTDLAFTPDKAPAGSPIGVASAMGTSSPSASGDAWTTTISLTVTDQADTVVGGAKVTGRWSDGSQSHCTTAADGTCTFTSSHRSSSRGVQVTWTLSSVGKPGNRASAGNSSKVTCTDPAHATDKRSDGTAPCEVVGTL